MHQLGNIWQDRFGLMHAEYLSVWKIIPPFVTECKGVCDCVRMWLKSVAELCKTIQVRCADVCENGSDDGGRQWIELAICV